MTRRQIPLYATFLHLALLALAVQVVILTRENRQLKSPPTPPPQQAGLEVGDSIEPLGLQSLDGADRTLRFAEGDKDRLLLVFTTTCSACKANQTAWSALTQDVGDSVEVVGISLDDEAATRSYRDEMRLTFPVSIPSDRDHLAEVLQISAVPLTLRIGTDGRVRGSWLGALSADQLAEARTEPAPIDRG